jgi:hypothetical protein
VSYNRLTEFGIATLNRACHPNVVKHAEQYGPNSDETEYLWYGDME